MQKYDFSHLSLEERFAMIEALWASLDNERAAPPVPQWHLDILEERMAEEEKGKAVFISHEEAMRNLRRGDPA